MHDFKNLRSAQESSSQQKDDKAERIVEGPALSTDDDWVTHAGPCVEAKISTTSKKGPGRREDAKPAIESDDNSAIQTTSADAAAKGGRDRRKKSKMSTKSSFYAASDVEGPPSRDSSRKIKTSPMAQTSSKLDASRKVAPRKGSLFSDVWEDFWKLPRALYPFYKWLILLYILWLLVTKSMVVVYHKAARQLEPICDLPLIGYAIPLCSGLSEAPPSRTINVTKVATSQEELDLVMNSVGQNFDLARDMVRHGFAVRDLRIRVAASDLSRRREIVNELNSLVHETQKTAEGLSRFTAKVGKSIDTVVTFDAYAVRTLEGITSRQQNVPTLPQKMVSFLHPLSAFELSGAAQTEEDIKDVFLSTSTRIEEKVKILLQVSLELGHGLSKIQEILDRLQELAVDEVGDLPQMDVLRALWTRLARKDDYSRFKAHETLLTDITDLYKTSLDLIQETVAALNRMKAELNEFRDDLATPGLTLQEQPLEITIELFRKSALRLESCRSSLENAKLGEYTQRLGLPVRAGTRTVTATLV